MNIRRAVSDFVSQGKGLFHHLRTEGEALSDLDLVALREQLHILDAEAGHIQDVKDVRCEAGSFLFDSRRPASAKASRNRHHA